MTLCITCNAGYYTTSGTSCVLCPSTCSKCSSYTANSQSYVNCTACFPTLTLKGPSPFTCQCASNQYKTTATPPTCVNCPTGCSGCASAAACTACSSGYYLAGSSCPPCMPVCATCASAATCSTCLSGLTLNSANICVCSSPKLLNPTTKTCQSCSTLVPNCLTCAYNPVYSPSAPVPVICNAPKSGYYITGAGTGTAACGSYCLTCTSNTVCTTCLPTFRDPATNAGTCSCPYQQSVTILSPATCAFCNAIIPNCRFCQFFSSTQCT